MTGPSSVAALDYERVPLEAALRTINEARAADAGAAGRVEGLLQGLDELLVARDIRGERDRDGGRALAELDRLLSEAGGTADTARIRDFLEPIVDRLVDALLGRPDERLAAYGSLRPGEVNHHHLADLVGRWWEGEVHGTLHPDGGRATGGFPGVQWLPEADPIRLEVFESPALPGHWGHLDAFEGPGYRRVLVTVTAAAGVVVANMYEIVEPPVPGGPSNGDQPAD